MVSLVRGPEGLAAYPLGKGSGAVTSFAQADGFVTVPAMAEVVEAGTAVEVRRIGRRTEPAGLVVIGSHCVGLDLIVGRLRELGIATKLLNVGSTGGLAAARRAECDIASAHLMDPATGEYNRPYLAPGLELVLPGYGRLQGVVFRLGDARFEGRTAEAAVAAVAED
jgi:putative molybdopterin biosynthesis protein